MTAIPVRTTRYQCPHCRRTWAHRWPAEKHIDRCFKNPAARSCKTCALYEPREAAEHYTGYPGCPESCGAGVSLTDGLQVHCGHWERESA